MTNSRLLNLIDAAKVLDNPDVTMEQRRQVSQLCSILAQSLDIGLPVGDDTEWPDASLKTAFDLALATMTYADSLSWPEGGSESMQDWWRDRKAHALTEWGVARRNAELAANDKVQAAT